MSRFTVLFMLGLCFALCACGGSAAESSEVPADPQTLLADAVDKMQAADGFRMTIEQSGASYPLSIALDGVNALPAELLRASAQYVRPDQLFVNLKLQMVITATVDAFLLGDRQWLSVPSGAPWRELPVYEGGFDMGSLMAEGAGIEAALSGLDAPQLLGETALIDGTKALHLRAVAGGEVLRSLLFGLIEPAADVQMDVYVGVDDRRIALIEMTMLESSGAAGENPSLWRVEFYDYDRAPDFEPPPAARAGDA